MPELLLSSAPQKSQNTNPLLDATKHVDKSSKSGVITGFDASSVESKKEGGFNNILTSIVKKPSTTESDLPVESASLSEKELNALQQAIQQVSEELAKLDPDSEYLSEFQSLLEGQDLSTFTDEAVTNGLSLPEFLTSLQDIVAKMTQNTDEVKDSSFAQSLAEESSVLMASLMKLGDLAAEISNKLTKPAEVSSSLLGFSFNSGKNNGGQWQQYEPQQMTQAVNLNQNGSVLGSGQVLNGHAQGLLSEQMLPETDKNFQTHISQILSETMQETSEISDTLIDSLIGNKEKPALKFSDLQLRTPSDGLKQYSTTLVTHVNAEQWGEEVSQKIVWFTGRNIQAAEMHLNPAELGPIDVKVHVQNDVTSITFNVQNASVRDLLESNVVRLREMIEANGGNLGDVNIDSGSREQSNSGEKSEQGPFGRTGQDLADTDMEIQEQEIHLKQSNLVDYFV